MITPSPSRRVVSVDSDDSSHGLDDRCDTISPLGTDLRSDARTL